MIAQILFRVIGLVVYVLATWSLVAGAVNLALDTSPTLAEKIINIPAAVAISLGGAVLFYYAKKTRFFETIFILVFAGLIFITEVNSQFGSYAISDYSYKQTSDAAVEQSKAVAMHESALKRLQQNDINPAELISRRAKLEGQLEAKKQALKVDCKANWKRCKAQRLTAIAKIEADIKAVNEQIELAKQNKSELTNVEKSLLEKSSDNNDYKKLHPHFISTAELVYGTPIKAESARVILRFVQAFAVVVFSYLGLRMAFYDAQPSPEKQHTEDKPFFNGISDAINNSFNKPVSTPSPITAQLPQSQQHIKDLAEKIYQRGHSQLLNDIPPDQPVNKNPIGFVHTALPNQAREQQAEDFIKQTVTLQKPVTVTDKPVTLKKAVTDNPVTDVTDTRQRGVTDKPLVTDKLVTLKKAVTDNPIKAGKIEKVCQYCGVVFLTTRLDAKFCKDACRVANGRLKNKNLLKGLNDENIN